jgi:hypothetical protein
LFLERMVRDYKIITRLEQARWWCLDDVEVVHNKDVRV